MNRSVLLSLVALLAVAVPASAVTVIDDFSQGEAALYPVSTANQGPGNPTTIIDSQAGALGGARQVTVTQVTGGLADDFNAVFDPDRQFLSVNTPNNVAGILDLDYGTQGGLATNFEDFEAIELVMNGDHILDVTVTVRGSLGDHALTQRYGDPASGGFPNDDQLLSFDFDDFASLPISDLVLIDGMSVRIQQVDRGNGLEDAADYDLKVLQLREAPEPPNNAVPEPSLGFLGLLGVYLATRRRRRA